MLIVAPTEPQQSKIAADLKNYGTAGGINAQSAVNDSVRLPFIDVILVAEDLGPVEIDKLFDAAAQTPRLQRAARLVITRTLASQWSQRCSPSRSSLRRRPLTLPASVKRLKTLARKSAVFRSMKRSRPPTLSARTDLLQKLAINRGQIYDLSAAEPTLLASLNDKRPEIVKAVGDALALMDFKEVQPGILTRAMDEKAPDDVKIGLYKSLSTSARFYGNRLSSDEVASLQKIVDGTGSNEVRTAAAEARGALNLPADLAKQLIVNQKD